MHVLMISDVYFPRINGVSTSIATFRGALERKGHRVTLIAPDYGHGADADERVVRIPARTVMFDPEDRMMRFRKIFGAVGTLKDKSFDIVHIQTPFVAHYAGMHLSRRMNLPRVATYHTFFEEYLHLYVRFLPRSWMRRAARAFSASQCNDVDAVVVPSTPMLNVLSSYGVKQQAAVVPTGLELSRFKHRSGDAFRSRYGIAPAQPTLTYIGRVAFEKNIEFLLTMLQHVRKPLPNVLLVVAGEGPASKHMQRLANTLGLRSNVMFVGYLDRETELLDCYAAADALVFASRTETQGLVLLEAMAMGVPVISTAVMGTRTILGARRGALIAPEDPAKFAATVVGLLKNHQLRERLSGEARRYAKQWSGDAFAVRLLDFYREVIASQRPTSQPLTDSGN